MEANVTITSTTDVSNPTHCEVEACTRPFNQFIQIGFLYYGLCESCLEQINKWLTETFCGGRIIPLYHQPIGFTNQSSNKDAMKIDITWPNNTGKEIKHVALPGYEGIGITKEEFDKLTAQKQTETKEIKGIMWSGLNFK